MKAKKEGSSNQVYVFNSTARLNASADETKNYGNSEQSKKYALTNIRKTSEEQRKMRTVVAKTKKHSREHVAKPTATTGLDF